MKRQLSLVLALVMILGSFSAVFAAEMPETAVDKAAFLQEEGILQGKLDGKLDLDEDLKRRDALVVLSRLLGKEEEAKTFSTEDSKFEDIGSEFYHAFAAWGFANEYVVGKTETTFDPEGPLTAQAFATYVLRALNYQENGTDIFKEAYNEAKKLEILAGLELEEKDTVTRGDMAAMTYNALGVVVKGGTKTLAETLDIVMPAPDKPQELKVEKVYTENLAEIVVELSNADLADKEKLEDANNYKLTGFSIVKAEVQEDNVVLSLKKDTSLVKNRKYDLLVRGLGKDLNKKYNFTAQDNTIPAVESVEILGEYGIRVTTTEPVKTPLERNFLIDGKNVAMEVEQYGREIILTPYHKASFDLKAEKLTVKELVDYEGYKSVEKDFEIEVKKDEEAPKVIDVIANNKEVKVIFDKDIYNNSVDAYYSRVSVGNVSYEAGRHPVYAEKAEKVDTNEVVYTFKDELPRRTIVTIVDVSNHSKVEMEKTTEEARIVLDNIEPEIIDHKVRKQSDSSVKIELYFDKDVKGNFVANSDTEFVAKDHFALYQAEVLKRNILEDKITKAEYAEDREDVVVVTIVDLQLNNKDKDYNYILEIVDFKDMSSNKMYRDYVDFDIKAAASAFKVVDVVVKENRADTEITIFFNKAVDRTIAEDLTNYIFRYDNATQTRYDVKDLDGKIITERNGKEVTIVLPDFNKDKYKSLEILETIKDKDGNRVAPSSRYVFGTNFDVFVARATKAATDGATLLVDADTLATLTALAPYTNASKHYEILKAVEAVEKLIDKTEEVVDGKVAVAKKALQKLVDEAKTVYAKLADKTTTAGAELAQAIANSESAIKDKDATLTQIGETATDGLRQALKTKLDAAKNQLGTENAVGVTATQVVRNGTDAVATQVATKAVLTVTLSGSATAAGDVTIMLDTVELAKVTLTGTEAASAVATALEGAYAGSDFVVSSAGDVVTFTSVATGLTDYDTKLVTTSSATGITAVDNVVDGQDQVINQPTKAEIDVTVVVTAGTTKVGKIKVELLGEEVVVEIPAGKTAAQVAELVKTAVNAEAGFGYTTTVAGDVITFTAANAGVTSLVNPVTITEVQ